MRLSCLLSCLLPLLLRLLLSSLYPGAWAMTFHLEVDGQNSNEQRHHCLFCFLRHVFTCEPCSGHACTAVSTQCCLCMLVECWQGTDQPGKGTKSDRP